MFDETHEPGARHWRPAEPGDKMLTVALYQPSTIDRVIMNIEECDESRAQEVQLVSSNDGGITFRELVRRSLISSPAEWLAIRLFFADPHSPGQRGTNENTNGLLRQYLPKGMDLSGYRQRGLNAITHRLNTRPRKCLHFAMPLEAYAQLRHRSPVALDL